MHAAIAAEIRAGGLGIGMAHQYYPGADHTEIFRVFELAAELDVPIYTHVRDMAVSAVQEVLANALATGALAPHRAPEQLEHPPSSDQPRPDQGRPGRGSWT